MLGPQRVKGAALFTRRGSSLRWGDVIFHAKAPAMADGDLALLLARAQFAFTISFHFIFPAFTIGVASYLAVLEALWLATGKAKFLTLFRYWLKIFAIVFAMGVVSG